MPDACRPDDRTPYDLRPIILQRGYLDSAPGAVLCGFGRTRVLCTATVVDSVPPHRREGGWVTAEYAMLPGSTNTRKARKTGGRETEIQRLIGRSLRAATDLRRLGERTIYLDCDVLQADGGTRTAAITGAWVALHDCLSALRVAGSLSGGDTLPLTGQVAAVSVGIADGTPVLDLCYDEDVRADVDMNVVMRIPYPAVDGVSSASFVEIQGTAEGLVFPREQLNAMLDLAEAGIGALFQAQEDALATP